ncbi:MAG: hypothetical protein PHE83_18040 [Opitutaceae bacterium]|nr:hypothetical protein [Opitutaceae bacterium]
MRISTDRLNQILSARHRNVFLALLGLSGGCLVAVTTAYLMRGTQISPDLMAAAVIGLLLCAWLGVAALEAANTRRAQRIDRILSQPENVRVMFDPRSRTLNLQQVGRVEMGGDTAEAIMESANLTVDEAERISAAMDAKSHIRLLQSPGANHPAEPITAESVS